MNRAGLVNSAIREVPFDFAASQGVPGWRDRLAWPLSHARAFATGRSVARAYLRFINHLDDDELRRVVLLGADKAFSLALVFAEAALCVQEESRAGVRLAGGPTELDLLRGEDSPPHKKSWQASSPFAPKETASWVWLRRLARTASWTPLRRLPATLISPTVTVVTHNELLLADARRSSERIGFCHAEVLLAEARQRGNGGGPAADFADPARALAEVLAHADGLGEPFTSRLRDLLLPIVQEGLAKAAADLQALAAMPALPNKLWSGSGGQYPSRALGMEVRRRGGYVTRFSHSWVAGLTEVVEPTVFDELTVSDCFVLETQPLAANLAATEALSLTGSYNRPVITGSVGCPWLRDLSLVSDRRPTRRTVLYAPTILKGFRQFLPPLLPDTVHLDWQFRLVETMLKWPIDLLCKPHPGGWLRGQVHPLAAIAPTRTEPFEEVMGEADVFVFDYAQSTTFYEALCTDRPIVYIDMGNPLFSRSVLQMIRRRCRVLRARFDERNVPHIDEAELKEAVCGGSDRADPGEFQALLMGEGEMA